MINLGKLIEKKDLRTVWPHEALDFTPWLVEDENLAMLSDAVGLEITLEETESGVGDFNVDIFAQETGTDRKIIIENQLEDTNHDHLGKLITYASGKEADIIIWIVKHAREEHRSAIEWLNNHTDEHIGFFLLEIKLYQIGDSDLAVKFEVIEKPNDWTKSKNKRLLRQIIRHGLNTGQPSMITHLAMPPMRRRSKNAKQAQITGCRLAWVPQRTR